jgi:hypothetical protein
VKNFYSLKKAKEMARYDELLDRNQNGSQTQLEQLELIELRFSK